MASQITDTLKASLNCCSANAAYNLDLRSQQGILTGSYVFTALVESYQNDMIQTYVPNGTVLIPGFIAYATIDLNDPAPPTLPDVAAVIIVDGQVIGIVPEGVYVTVEDLAIAIADAINTGPTLYTCIDNGDGTVTIVSPGPGTLVNGFVVSIEINPALALDTSVNVGSVALRQMIHIDDVGSGLNEHTLVAALRGGKQWVDDIYNKVLIGSYQVFPNPDPTSVLVGSGADALVYRESNDTVVTVASLGQNAWVLDTNLSQVSTIPNVKYATFAIHNDFNDCLYFSDTTNGKIKKVDTGNNITDITLTAINPTPKSVLMAFDPIDGYVWVLSAAGATPIHRIHPTTNAVDDIAAPVITDVPKCITYYPGDGTALSQRMLISFSNADVASYNMDGTLDNASFYAAQSSAILYSVTYNLFFVQTGTDLLVTRMDGSLKQTLSGVTNNYLLEDTTLGYIIGNDSTSAINFYTMVNDGFERYLGVLGDGTPDVVQTEADQCVSEALMNSLAQSLKAECGCDDCGEVVSGLPVTPSSATYAIYSGNSANAALTASGIEALSLSSLTTYAGTYNFIATSPSEYKYIAYPAQLGTPTRIYDPSTGFDVSMDTVYQVTINYIVYNVLRTYNLLGGAQLITLTS